MRVYTKVFTLDAPARNWGVFLMPEIDGLAMLTGEARWLILTA